MGINAMNTSNIIPITDFRNSAKEILEQVKQAPVILTQRSRPAAVIVDYDAYRKLEKKLEQLQLAYDDLLLAHAKDTSEQFISVEELITDYEESTGQDLS